MISILFSRKARRRAIVAACLIFVVSGALLYQLSKAFTGKTSLRSDFTAPETVDVAQSFVSSLHFNAQPDSQLLMPQLAEAINQAQTRITLAMFSFEAPELGEALQEAYDRGVEVTVILDKSNHRRHRWFLTQYPDIPVVELGKSPPDPRAFMHHKFLLVDEGTPAARLFYGSLNYTTLQENIDPSFVLETRDPTFITAFSSEAAILRRGLWGHGKFKTDYRPWAQKLHYPNGWMEVWFSPGFAQNSAKERLLQLLRNAQRTIDVAVWVFTDDDIARMLQKKAADGVRVRLIADDAFFWGEDSALPVLDSFTHRQPAAPLDMISDSFRTVKAMEEATDQSAPLHTSYLHQHFAIIDGEILITGTNNWSANGFFENDESIIVTNIPAIVEPFAAWWQRQYAELRVAKLQVSWENEMATLSPDQSATAAALRVYAEPAIFGQKPILCFTAEGTALSKPLNIRETCLSSRNHAFLLDSQGGLMAGAYL